MIAVRRIHEDEIDRARLERQLARVGLLDVGAIRREIEAARRRPVSFATSSVVPEPQNGSTTRSPGFV